MEKNHFEVFNTTANAGSKMNQTEFVNKTKELLKRILDNYLQGWENRPLKDEEYPNENVCDKCTGFGTFLLNSEERDCVIDHEQGQCFHRSCDYEQVGISLETNLEDMYELLSVDEVAPSNPQH